MYSLMLLIDFVFLLVIPLQICLNLNAEEGSDYIDLNFIQSLGKVSSHLYVTDIINAVLLVLFVISVIIIIRFDTRLTNIRL